MSANFRKISAEEAAEYIKHNDTIACSGFTAAGCVKKVTESLAKKAEREHFSGKNFQVRVFSGASTTDHVDGALSRAKAISYRTPYQSNKDTRNAINQGEIAYADQHLSTYPQFINYGFLGDIDYAIVEVSDYTDDGHLTLTMSAGAVPTFCRNAKHIILEHNTFYSGKLQGLHDIYELANPPHRQAIPLLTPSDRIGTTTVKVDPEKIIGVVETCEEDHLADFKEISPIHEKIGQHVAQFF
ncbi:MAG: acetyl-CoA hydrolase, partial [bacterium]